MIKPMLCETSDNQLDNQMLKDYSHYFYELKYDGERILFSQNRLYNRQFFPKERDFPFIYSQLKDSGVECDGEIAFKDGKDFNRFQNKRTANQSDLIYYVFHIFKGDLPKSDNIKLVERHDNGYALFKYAMDMNYEGIIAKKRNYNYRQGIRSNEWVKFKCFKTAIIRVTDFEYNKAGITFSNPIRVACNGHQHIEVVNKFKENGYLDIEIQYLEKTINNAYRQPSFIRCVK